MNYWDASAVVPLLVQQSATSAVEKLLRKNGAVVTWWGTGVECYSAIMRLQRSGLLDESEADRSLARLRELQDGWSEVVPSAGVRHLAERLLRIHPLRAADALQLAAALCACDGDTGRMGFVCLDERLAAAARKEGFALSCL